MKWEDLPATDPREDRKLSGDGVFSKSKEFENGLERHPRNSY